MKKNNKKNNKILLFILVIILFVFGGLYFIINGKVSDSKRFSKEYESMKNIDNVYVYKDIDEIIKILNHGTGVVYLGFPECPWCSYYVKVLNNVAKDNGIDKIYYFNILNDRKNNTTEYQELVSLLNDYLQYDDEGNKRIFVPAVIVINNGNIIGFDDETSNDTKGYDTPEEYWENEDLDGLKNKLSELFKQINSNKCTSDCNK